MWWISAGCLVDFSYKYHQLIFCNPMGRSTNYCFVQEQKNYCFVLYKKKKNKKNYSVHLFLYLYSINLWKCQKKFFFYHFIIFRTSKKIFGKNFLAIFEKLFRRILVHLVFMDNFLQIFWYKMYLLENSKYFSDAK